MWYTKRVQSVLTSLWYCMTGVQLMVSDADRIFCTIMMSVQTGVSSPMESLITKTES